MKSRRILILVTLLAWTGLFAGPSVSHASRLPIRPLEPELIDPPQWDPEVPDGGRPERAMQDGPTHAWETDSLARNTRASVWAVRLLRFLRFVRLSGVIQ